eukprot:sb/3478062/
MYCMKCIQSNLKDKLDPDFPVNTLSPEHPEGCFKLAVISNTIPCRYPHPKLHICAITPVYICITRPARGALFPHIGPLRSNGTICNISPERSEGDIFDTHKVL